MQTYSFTFIVKGQAVCSEEMADAIYAAGGDDSGVGSSDGVVYVHFDREAESFDDAVRSAGGVLSQAGYEAERLEIESVDLAVLLAG